MSANPVQYITLVSGGGTPVRLADQRGAPYPTTGSGALVFAENSTLTSLTIDGDLTYTGTLIGPYHSPLTTQGDLYYYGAGGNTRLPIGANGTVLSSNGTNASWQVLTLPGTGTVTTISVTSANGFAGTVATPTTTPAITLQTTITGLLKGNGTAMSAAVGGTDYMRPSDVSTAYQPLDTDLTALAGLNATAGLVEQTGAAAYTKRLIGVANATDIPTRANADARYAPISIVGTLTGVTAGTGVTVSGSAPSPTVGLTNQIAAGSIGDATHIPVLTYNAQGQLTAVTTATPSGGGASITVSDTAPGSPSAGALWWNSTLGALFLYYTDPNSSQWVPAAPSAQSGTVLQTVSAETGAMATGTTAIPADDTIPQITEGDQYMSLAITPRSATSRLIIDVTWIGTNSFSTVSNLFVALFQDATANALAVAMQAIPTGGYVQNMKLTHVMTSGTTSSTTFRVRAGGQAGTTTFNGSAGARFMGGVLASSIVIQEVT